MNNDKSLYYTVYESIKNDIISGIYHPGERILTEKQVTEKYFVSRITANKALSILHNEGYIIRYPGKGSYVSADFQQKIEIGDIRPRRIMCLMSGCSTGYGLDVLRGMILTANSLNIDITVKLSKNNNMLEQEILRGLEKSDYQGLLIQPANNSIYSEQLIQLIYSFKFPVVLFDRYLQGIDVPFVGIDNEAASCQAMCGLLEKGHKNILLLASCDQHSSAIRERISGYKLAYQMNGIYCSDEYMLLNLCADSFFSSETIMEATTKLVEYFKTHSEVTAVFATEYWLAVAAANALECLNMQDRCFVTFDNELGIFERKNKFSYIIQPQYKIGEASVKVIDKLMKGEKISSKKWIFEADYLVGSE